MLKGAPEQLSIDFGHTDPISEKYPRRHEFRQIRTIGEITVDFADKITDFVEKPKVSKRIRSAISVIAVATAVYAGWSLKDEYDEYERERKTIYKYEDYENDFVDCSDGVTTNIADLEYDADYDYLELYSTTALNDLESWVALRAELEYANSLSVVEATESLDTFLEDSPVKIIYDVDLKDEQDFTNLNSDNPINVTRNEIKNLAIAMYSIPSTLYEYAGIDTIRIVDEIQSPKSEEQLELELANAEDVGSVDEFNYSSGRYIKDKGTVEISKGALFDRSELLKLLFHEVIGHGVMMTNCDPYIDADWHKLNSTSGVMFKYMPIWKRTPEMNKLFESGIVVHNWYAGTSPREDAAETSTILAPSFSITPQYFGILDNQNGSIVDEKTKLIFDRVSEVEPSFGRFLSLQYELSRITDFYSLLSIIV